jgi:cobyrinic acid a,c-diamide synthase
VVDTPRIVVAGTDSGVGETRVASLYTEGFRVAPIKAGPDPMDPSYHILASSRHIRTCREAG